MAHSIEARAANPPTSRARCPARSDDSRRGRWPNPSAATGTRGCALPPMPALERPGAARGGRDDAARGGWSCRGRRGRGRRRARHRGPVAAAGDPSQARDDKTPVIRRAARAGSHPAARRGEPALPARVDGHVPTGLDGGRGHSERPRVGLRRRVVRGMRFAVVRPGPSWCSLTVGRDAPAWPPNRTSRHRDGGPADRSAPVSAGRVHGVDDERRGGVEQRPSRRTGAAVTTTITSAQPSRPRAPRPRG